MNAHIDVCVWYGNYGWCGSNYDGEKSGFYLSTLKSNYYFDKKVMINVNVKMSEELYEAIDHINIFDNTNFLSQYTNPDRFCNDTKSYNFYFKIEDKFQNTEMKIIFYKYLPPLHGKLYGMPLKTIYETTFIVPELTVIGSNVCSICLENVENDKYISPCKHIFHQSCIHEYLLKGKFLRPLSVRCFEYCEHSEKFNEFNCPNCRNLIMR